MKWMLLQQKQVVYSPLIRSIVTLTQNPTDFNKAYTYLLYNDFNAFKTSGC